VSAEDDEHSGWPSTSKTTENVGNIQELIHEDCCRTIHELADTTEISYGVFQEILTENLNMHRTAAALGSTQPLREMSTRKIPGG
jgi:hypothetical protein